MTEFYFLDEGSEAHEVHEVPVGWYAVLDDKTEVGPFDSEELARAYFDEPVVEVGNGD